MDRHDTFWYIWGKELREFRVANTSTMTFFTRLEDISQLIHIYDNDTHISFREQP